MASEKVTVTITSSVGEDAPLTVEDAMRQILDFFSLLSAAGEDSSSLVVWQLVEISMQSPLRATAQAFPAKPGIDSDPIAQREKAMLASSLDSIVRGELVPEWMDQSARDRAKGLFSRNANGIGRMQVKFDEDAPLTIIDQKRALAALDFFTEYEQAAKAEDKSRIEMGSIEGNVILTGAHYNQPAIQIRERLSSAEVWCVFTPEVANSIGSQHSWAETWRNRRVLVTGAIHYGRDGKIQRVNVSTLREIDPVSLSYEQIADPNFTGGLAASDYIRSLWEEDIE